jgi:hypothetical protein
MPKPPKKSEDDLVFLALEALEDEMKAWRHTIGHGGYVKLIRYPSIDVGFAAIDVPSALDQEVEMQHVKPQEVWPFLRWRGMQAAVKAIREAEK